MRTLSQRLGHLLERLFPRLLREMMDDAFVARTENYGHRTWLGHPIWQNVNDLWVIQEVISNLKPSWIIETGTNRGGSSLFYAHLLDLLGHGRILTIDVEKLHEHRHPRVEYLIGSAASQDIIARVQSTVELADGPVLVILDSDHSQAHVSLELEHYHPFVTPGSYLLVQDGIIDTLPRFAHARPGPLPAIRDFLSRHPEFQVDDQLCDQFPISHHPQGWLKRLPQAPTAPCPAS